MPVRVRVEKAVNADPDRQLIPLASSGRLETGIAHSLERAPEA